MRCSLTVKWKIFEKCKPEIQAIDENGKSGEIRCLRHTLFVLKIVSSTLVPPPHEIIYLYFYETAFESSDFWVACTSSEAVILFQVYVLLTSNWKLPIVFRSLKKMKTEFCLCCTCTQFTLLSFEYLYMLYVWCLFHHTFSNYVMMGQWIRVFSLSHKNAVPIHRRLLCFLALHILHIFMDISWKEYFRLHCLCQNWYTHTEMSQTFFYILTTNLNRTENIVVLVFFIYIFHSLSFTLTRFHTRRNSIHWNSI